MLTRRACGVVGCLLPALTSLSHAQPTEMIWPARLQPGDTIMFVAPAGDLDLPRMTRARQRLEERGYRVKYRDDLFVKDGYLAGSDQRRADELMQAFRDPEVKAIFPGTGGYGTMRILDRLDYEVIRANPKILIGFSDITGLHAAINRRAGLVTRAPRLALSHTRRLASQRPGRPHRLERTAAERAYAAGRSSR